MNWPLGTLGSPSPEPLVSSVLLLVLCVLLLGFLGHGVVFDICDVAPFWVMLLFFGALVWCCLPPRLSEWYCSLGGSALVGVAFPPSLLSGGAALGGVAFSS